MAQVQGKSTIVLLDFEHETAKVTFNWSTTDTTSTFPLVQALIVSVLDDIAACSNMVMKRENAVWEVWGTDKAPTKAGEYPNSEDRLILTYVDSKGNPVKLSIPAPKDDNFLSDQETVDPTSAHISALTTLLTAAPDGTTGWFACSQAGNPITDLVRGQRLRGKGKKEAPGYFQAEG